jgi:thiamine kinase
MTAGMNAFEALALVPGWDHENADIEELKGGLTNRVYHVRSNGQQCVLRLNADHSGTFNLDRTCELPILDTAAEAGIAPHIFYSDVDAGILVTEYLEGTVWQEADLDSVEKLEALAGLLRQVHELPPCCTRVDLVEIGSKYAEYLRTRHGLHAFASICVNVINEIPSHDQVVCCHNDVVAANVIGSENIKLIDWEYACDNDPLFDLASAIGFHNLDERRQQIFLSAYAGGADNELRERLSDQIRVFDAVQWLWLATRQLVSPHRDQARRLEELQMRIR